MPKTWGERGEREKKIRQRFIRNGDTGGRLLPGPVTITYPGNTVRYSMQMLCLNLNGEIWWWQNKWKTQTTEHGEFLFPPLCIIQIPPDTNMAVLRTACSGRARKPRLQKPPASKEEHQQRQVPVKQSLTSGGKKGPNAQGTGSKLEELGGDSPVKTV